MVFADFDLDKIRNARLLIIHPYEQRESAEESLKVMTLLQPRIFAWQVMSVPLSPTERQGAAILTPNLPLTDAPAADGIRGQGLAASCPQDALSYVV
jgi:hypothetical protein